MKILLINKYHYIKGGSETYFFSIKNMLEKKGHDVITFSMKDDKNIKSQYEKFFVKNIDYNDRKMKSKIRNAINLINSREAYNKLCKLIKDTKPDIAHVNLIYHQLTPSVFHALKKYNIPIVFTSHDYKMICPNYKIYNNNKTCKKCYGGKYYNCLLNKCHKNSFLGSFLLTIEAYFHKTKKSYNLINKIICPSNFMKEQLEQAGIENTKLIHIPNFVGNNFYDYKCERSFDVNNRGKTILYYGRLSEEKGIDLILEAKKNISDNIKLKIVGEGPKKEELFNKVKNDNIPNVEFLGFKIGKDLMNEIRKSYCTIIPSNCEEVFGLTIIESYCMGSPVIGSNKGGIKELIKPGKTGFLFENNNVNSLVDKINKIMDKSHNEYINMRKNCLKESYNYNSDLYYNKLIKIYKEVVENY